jgi:hypothetical protein
VALAVFLLPLRPALAHDPPVELRRNKGAGAKQQRCDLVHLTRSPCVAPRSFHYPPRLNNTA